MIIFSGIRLTTYADKLSDQLQFGKIWVGIVLLGLVTSLPEAVTSLTAVISMRADNLAIGNLVGSNNFNPMLIVVMDIMYRKGSITDAIHPDKSHRVSSSLAVVLALIVVAEIALPGGGFLGFHIGRLSIGSILIAVLYIGGIKYLAAIGISEHSMPSASEQKPKTALRRIWINLAVSAALVTVGAIWLANTADLIAQQTGLGHTFFGSIFLAFVTSLPEIVVSLSALRLGSFDLAVGNIFGSNMTNMFIVFVCGLFHRGDPILSAVSKTHMVTAALGILLTGVVMTGIHIKGKKTVFGIGWDSVVMIGLFIAGTAFLYELR